MATPFNCIQQGIQVAGTTTSLYLIDLVTGGETLVGQLQPAGRYNAIGYSVIDNFVYGYNTSTNRLVIINPDATTETLPVVPNLPNNSYNIGDVDLNGYYYLYSSNTNRFYVVDVNPARSTYLQLVDPANNFQLQTSNFGVALGTPDIRDWSFNPVDGQLYTVNNNARVLRIDPITGAITPLTTSGPMTAAPYGATYYDVQGNLYAINNNTGRIFKITTTATTANATLFSIAVSSSNNDGTRCPLAALNLMSVDKTVNTESTVLGDTLTYTIVITNNSTTTDVTSVIFTDPYPNGTTYVGGSATVDGSPVVGTPDTGIVIGTITTGNSVTVEYQVDISDTTLPYPNPIPNTATVTYNEGLPVESNTVYTRVIFPERGVRFI